MKTLAEVLQSAIDHETEESRRDFYRIVYDKLTIEQAQSPAGKPLEDWLKQYYGC
jgi:hypothetical protein